MLIKRWFSILLVFSFSREWVTFGLRTLMKKKNVFDGVAVTLH
jgi:hypothetical protein